MKYWIAASAWADAAMTYERSGSRVSARDDNTEEPGRSTWLLLYLIGTALFYFRPVASAVCFTMLTNSADFKPAPPTRAPSISGCAMNSLALALVTLPP